MQREMRALLGRVVAHCAAADRDFWPAGLVPAGADAAAAGSTDAAAAGSATGNIWQLLGLSAPATATAAEDLQAPPAADLPTDPAAADTAAATSAFVEAEAQQLLRFQLERQHAAVEPSGATAVAQRAQQQTAVLVVTVKDAMAEVAASLAALSLPWSTLMVRPLPPTP